MCVSFFTVTVIFLGSFANRHLKIFFGEFDLLKNFLVFLILVPLFLNTSKKHLKMTLITQ